jgi:hypothetical protein
MSLIQNSDRDHACDLQVVVIDGCSITMGYNPEKEFDEIGVNIDGKTFWKLDQDQCEAIIDDEGNTSASLMMPKATLQASFLKNRFSGSRSFPLLMGLSPTPSSCLKISLVSLRPMPGKASVKTQQDSFGWEPVIMIP